MLVGTLEVKLYAPWVHSLKEKRMILKSIMGKLKNHFNIAVNEVAQQDTHQIMVIGIAMIATQMAGIDTTLDHIIEFIEQHTEAEILEMTREVY